MTRQEEDAKLGRVVRCYARWAGASILICLVLRCVLGEESQYDNWTVFASLLGGMPIAIWLTKKDQ